MPILHKDEHGVDVESLDGSAIVGLILDCFSHIAKKRGHSMLQVAEMFYEEVKRDEEFHGSPLE